MASMATTVAVSTVTLEIDGRSVTVPEGTTIWTAARELGIEIPVLCHDERYDPVGVCRVCAVDVGGRVLAAACIRPVEQDMSVRTSTEQVERVRRTLTELLESDQPPAEVDRKETTTADNELLALSLPYGVERETANLPTGGDTRPLDMSNPVIAMDHASCILCDRCIRACDDVQSNDVIGRTGKGYDDAHRLRPRPADGRQHLRLVRRVRRRRVPTGALDQQADHAAARAARPDSRRSRASARTAASAARSPTTSTDENRSSGPRAATARQPRPALRQGPLRLGLRHATISGSRGRSIRRHGVLPEGTALGGRPR